MNEQSIAEYVATELIKANADYRYAPPMYHGTNQNALSMTTEERFELNTACETIQTYLLKICDENGCDSGHFGSKEILGENYGRILRYCSEVYLRKEGAKGYSYGDIYLTNSPRRANNYATDAVALGETGCQTYWLNEGVKRMGYSFPPKSKEEEQAFELFEWYAVKEDEPVTLMFCGLSMDSLLNEVGNMRNMTIPLGVVASFRCIEKLDLNAGVRISPADVQTIGLVTTELESVLRERHLECFNGRIRT